MDGILAAPLILPLATAILLTLVPMEPRARHLVIIASGLAYLGFGAVLLERAADERVLVLQVGNWPAPYGITLAADLFSALMILVTGVMSTTLALYVSGSREPETLSPTYAPVLQLLIMGVSGAFLSGDLFNIYVWFEVMLMASYVLLGLGGSTRQIAGGVKYVTLNLLASALLLSAVGVLYGFMGTVNLADLALRIRSAPANEPLQGVVFLFFIAFGIKSAVFPLYFWLPAAYPAASPSTAALFSAFLTKVGVYALLRTFTLLFGADSGPVFTVVLVLATLTMISGVLGAASQNEIRRILSFHIVSQIGYMMLAVAFLTPLALAGAIYFIIHNILAKTNLFLVSGLVDKIRGTTDLSRLGGMSVTHPAVALVFLISALSLAGIPPLPGFFGKLMLVKAGIELESYVAVGAALMVGILTLFSMTKIWAGAFWGSPPSDTPQGLRPAGLGPMLTASGILAGLIGALALSAGSAFELALRAGNQMLDWEGYVRAVLGGRS